MATKTIQERVKEYFEHLGYTQPGQSLNVATAEAAARQIAYGAEVDARNEVINRCCGRCQAKFEREDGGTF